MFDVVIVILKDLVTAFAWWVYGLAGMFMKWLFTGELHLGFAAPMVIGIATWVIAVIVVGAWILHIKRRS